MSTHLQDLDTLRGNLQVSEFFSGGATGTALQLTQGFGDGPDTPGFIQLSTKDVAGLLQFLSEWLRTTCTHDGIHDTVHEDITDALNVAILSIGQPT